MNDIVMPEIKLCRMGQYAALYVDGSMIELRDFRVTQSMKGVNRVTVTFDVPDNLTELNLTNVSDSCG